MEHQPLKKTNNRIWAGVLLLAVGAILLLARMGIPFPGWLFQWPLILIVLGMLDGLRHGFRGGVWIVLLLAGSFFLLDNLEPELNLRRYTWPLLIIAVGIGLIVRPKRNAFRLHEQIGQPPYHHEGNTTPPPYGEPVSGYSPAQTTDVDYLDAVSIFGATRKIVMSKHFQGGDLVCFFGGHEVDLRQADIQGSVVLDVTQIFGGTKLIIPSGWHVKSEMVALLGGIEDKRQMMNVTVNPDKVLVLKGTSIFGGIDIRNY